LGVGGGDFEGLGPSINGVVRFVCVGWKMVVLWSNVASVSDDAPLCGAAACEFAGSVYLFGGFQRDKSAPTAELRHCVFDIGAQEWRTPESLDVDGAVPTPRAGCTATRVNSTVYLFGGQQVWPEEQLDDFYAASIVRPGARTTP